MSVIMSRLIVPLIKIGTGILGKTYYNSDFNYFPISVDQQK